MTALYSSVREPREVFGEGTRLLEIFYETVKDLMPGAWELNEALLGTWQPNNYSHDWTLPDNFHVHIKVMNVKTKFVNFLNEPRKVNIAVNEPSEEGRANGANTIHSIDGMIVREMVRRCSYDKNRIEAVKKALEHSGKSQKREEDKMVMILWNHYQKSGFLSARILNYLDSMNMGLVDAKIILDLIQTLPAKPFNLLTVHDCFRVHPNYGNDVRRQYNQIMHEIAKSDLLAYVVSQIVGYTVTVDKKGKIADEILESNYALS